MRHTLPPNHSPKTHSRALLIEGMCPATTPTQSNPAQRIKRSRSLAVRAENHSRDHDSHAANLGSDHRLIEFARGPMLTTGWPSCMKSVSDVATQGSLTVSAKRSAHG